MKPHNMIITAVFSGLFTIAAFAGDNQQTWTGTVSDSMCGKQHLMNHTHPAQCARACVKSAADYALVVGDKVYTLKGDKAQIEKLAGEKASVIGTAKEGTITVESIAASKK